MEEDRTVISYNKAENNPDVIFVTKLEFHTEMDGGAIRAANVARELDRRGLVAHYIYARHTDRRNLATFGFLDWWFAVKCLARFCRTGSVSCAKWFSLGAALEMSVALRSFSNSVLLLEFPQLYPYVQSTDRFLWLDLQNVESELLRNYAVNSRGLRAAAAYWEAARVAGVERRALARARKVSVVSSHDRDGCIALGADPMNLLLAPNGTSMAKAVRKRGEVRYQVIFVASLGWRPNIDAASWLVKEVWPLVLDKLPDAQLLLAGRTPAQHVWDLRSESVSVAADVPDVSELLAVSAVATAPLWTAGGTRLKIVEAMASGIPVVSTSLGALGLESLGGRGLFIVDDPALFAEKIVSLVNNPPDPQPIRAAVAMMDWSATLSEFGETWMKVLGTDERRSR